MRIVGQISPFDLAPSEWWGFLIVIPLGILYFIALALLLPALPRPRANALERRLRIGRRTWEFAEINLAELAISHEGKQQNTDLKFGRTGGTKLYVKLTVRGKRVIGGATQALLEQIIEGSSILTQRERERERDAGSASRYSYPTGLSREDALDAVRNPPR